MSDSEYVTNGAWLRQVGRPDAIDEVADQFERREPAAAEAFWTPDTNPAWPRTSRGWRAATRVHNPDLERRAAS